MAYMGMYHSDDSLQDYEDEFFGDYDLFEDDEIEEEERYEADEYEPEYPEYWNDEEDYWADEDDSFDLWLGGF